LINTRPSAAASVVVVGVRNPNSFGSRGRRQAAHCRAWWWTVRAADVARGCAAVRSAAISSPTQSVSSERSRSDSSVAHGAPHSIATTSKPSVTRFDMRNNHRLIDTAVRE
jgi:hypothetical protein